ncbi:vacuolar protein sorting-associated protein [Pseudozyma hubeiensis SY62]|uniref:Vacuolar protein sorting-associated protein n=1 Tax=Pseudozyma hubeiensis (strain SY62) TaxID=1305764 RepID=R9NX18_PSEHS|nr:vacuolar protein sorting-associated protein [Pseudozyma hubeiensis SY62]GAC93183.1 vacuolar protein sorting-associated protein [Pseudozyma hubeiensis SY62]
MLLGSLVAIVEVRRRAIRTPVPPATGNRRPVISHRSIMQPLAHQLSRLPRSDEYDSLASYLRTPALARPFEKAVDLHANKKTPKLFAAAHSEVGRSPVGSGRQLPQIGKRQVRSGPAFFKRSTNQLTHEWAKS